MNYEKSSEKPQAVERNYRDTLFRMIFKEPEAMLSLYNAVNGTDYRDPGQLQVVTLENAIYVSMKNDLAFIIDCRMNLYEQQSSVNPNMPLRDLFYVAREYQGMVSSRSLYSSRPVRLPTPSFVVFYHGTARQPERREMKLSDAFQISVEEPALELKVVQLNISPGHNRELLEKCPLLEQYSCYAGRVQQYVREMSLEDAVERAVKECIREGILAEFLQKNRAEAIEVCIFEFDEEREMALLRKEELRDEVIAEVREELQEKVREEVQEELQEKVREEVREELQEKVREEVREELQEKVREEIEEEVRTRVRTEMLIELVCKKLSKGTAPEKIAEELGEETEFICRICQTAASYATEYDSRKIYDAMQG